MSDSKRPSFQFSLGGLLIIMAAVAMAAAFVAKASPFARRMGEQGNYNFLIAVVLFTSLLTLPPAFVLAVRLGIFGVRGRKPDRKEETPKPDDRPPQPSVWDDPKA